jgi:hypothetical protein
MAMSSLTYIPGFSVKFYFQEEDVNVIFYQNRPNLHNRYKSAERKISQISPEYMLNYSLPCKIEISSIVHGCFSINQNELQC